ncbi:MAG TPA: DUF2273 domain-containing protein [Firmicutes bacterium]|nr:DUF2273 domain-containing protein [Bacillota bacterium]
MGSEKINLIFDFLDRNWGKVIGGLLGLILGILFLKYGFWRTILLILIVTLGVYAGDKYLDSNSFHDFIDRFRPSRR